MVSVKNALGSKKQKALLKMSLFFCYKNQMCCYEKSFQSGLPKFLRVLGPHFINSYTELFSLYEKS